jgi:hypothetical protein
MANLVSAALCSLGLYSAEVECYGKIVRTPEDGRDVNETTA